MVGRGGASAGRGGSLTPPGRSEGRFCERCKAARAQEREIAAPKPGRAEIARRWLPMPTAAIVALLTIGRNLPQGGGI